MPKEFLTYQQQREKLRSSGLTIEGEGACCRVLADIGYFPAEWKKITRYYKL